MSRILGIDPGSRITGFGVIEMRGQRSYYLGCGCIRMKTDSLPLRLQEIFSGISEVVTEYQPTILSIEQVFMAHNAASALKLGHARGAAIVACVSQGLTVFEYAPTQIKQTVTGQGHAEKIQVQHMVKILLGLSSTPQADAADALAAALCHAHMRPSVHLSAVLRQQQR